MENKKAELAGLTEEYAESFWHFKEKYDDDFKEAFSGGRGDKNRFMAMLLAEEANTSDLLSLAELKEKAETVFADSLSPASQIPTIATEKLLEDEQNPILKKVVVGKKDVDLSALIEHLESSDWVDQGRKYIDAADGKCPFCQQALPKGFVEELEQYFDESYIADKSVIASLEASYLANEKSVMEAIDTALSACGGVH